MFTNCLKFLSKNFCHLWLQFSIFSDQKEQTGFVHLSFQVRAHHHGHFHLLLAAMDRSLFWRRHLSSQWKAGSNSMFLSLSKTKQLL